MYFTKRLKRRKTSKAKSQNNPYDPKSLRRKLKIQRGRKNNLVQNDAKGSNHFVRKVYYPPYARKRPSRTSNRRYDDYEYQYYDYNVPIDIQPEDYYYYDAFQNL